MIEVIIVSLLVASVLAVSVRTTIQIRTARNRPKISSRPRSFPRPTLSQLEQDELEQNAAWWDRAFHGLLSRSGAKVVAQIDSEEYVDMRTGLYRGPVPRKALEGCMCRSCLYVVEESKRRALEPKKEIPLHNGNAYVNRDAPVAMRVCGQTWTSYTDHYCHLPVGHSGHHWCFEHPQSWSWRAQGSSTDILIHRPVPNTSADYALEVQRRMGNLIASAYSVEDL